MRALRQARVDRSLPTLENKLPPLELLSEEQVRRIHHASLAILEDVGVDVRDPIALKQWREVGAQVEGERVRLDGGLVMELKIWDKAKILCVKCIKWQIVIERGGRDKSIRYARPMAERVFLRQLEESKRNILSYWNLMQKCQVLFDFP